MSGETPNHGEERKIKCVVWDLDNTLWNGVLLEDERVRPRDEVVHIVKTLDSRGILQSIASRNDHDKAMGALAELGLWDCFIYPRIHWNTKSSSIEGIAKSINIGMDTIAFIDDQSFELEEVAFAHPEVLCIDAANLDGLLDMPEMNPRFITDESKIRRAMYQSDIRRNRIEDDFEGAKDEFLSTLDMVFTIGPASEEDLQRAEELTVRTHQLNTTGRTYSYDELDHFRRSGNHRLIVASLDDKYGTYGKIGLCLMEIDEELWTIKLLLMSCRVMSRGVGAVFLNHIRNQAREAGVRLRAEFLPTDVNRMMYMSYKFAHFKECNHRGDLITMENDLTETQACPEYVKLVIAP